MSKKYNVLTPYDKLKNYREIAKKVKEIIIKFDAEAETYVFGSVTRGRYTGASDIDILVITDKVDLKYDMMAEVYRLIDAPIELHISSRKEFNNWYSRFISPEEMEKI